jgi:hypothetical protein
VLALPPAGADPDERPAARQDVEGGGRLGRDPRRAEGHRRHEGAEPQPGVEAGQQAERHPGLGDRLPGRADLRDLDEVVHQREPGEARLVGRERHVAQPGRRVVAPREPRDLEHHVQTLLPRPVGLRRRCRRRGHVGAGHLEDPVPALVGQHRAQRAERADLLGEHRGGHGPVPVGVAPPAQLGRRVERDDHGGQPVRAGQVEPPPPSYVVQTEGVHDGAEPASHPAADDQVEKGEGLRRGIQVVPAAPDDAAQVVGGDDLGRPVAGPGPRRLAGAGGADEHDQCRVRQRLVAHARSLAGRRLTVALTG